MGRGRARAHQCARDHDYSFSRSRPRSRAGTGQKSVGRVHDCNDNSDRSDHGSRSAQREIQRRMDQRVWIGWVDLRCLGWTISRTISVDRSLVSTRSKMDRLGDHDLRVGGVDPPSLDAAHAARLLEHIFETGNGRGIGGCRGFAASNVVDAVDLALC